VKSHQDKRKQYKELDMLGCMNVDANKIVDEFRLQMERGKETQRVEGEWCALAEIRLLIRGKLIQSHYAHQI
jgi:hypothetical protein